jgi:Flp pilus assembly protein TadD
MAEMAEKANRADAVEWRKRIVHQRPADVPAQIALSRAALRFGQHDLAERVLATIPEARRQNVAYQQVAGTAAMGAQRLDVAETCFAAALHLDPTNPQLATNLAMVRLASLDQRLVTQARADLARLSAEPAVRLECLRALTGDAVSREQRDEARKWAAGLRAEKDATFSDVLLCFDAFEATDQGARVFEELKAKAAATPETAAQFITWLNRNHMAVVAAHWSTTLPTQIVETQPVPLAIAESYSFLQDWNGMQAWVEGKDWGEFEPLRLAVASHALHRLTPADRPSAETQTIWRKAVETAKQHRGQVVAIAQLAQGWGYDADAEDAWWIVATGNDNPKMGLNALQRLYKSKKDTRGLLRVAKRALELNPNDLVAANNCASLSLLLSGDSTARRLAAKLHTEHPANRAFAATYAYALQTEGKLPEALELMETLKEEELQNPAIAAYYVVMLVENGKLDRARSYLAAAQKATLLPEEQQLLSAATRKLLASATVDPAKSIAELTTR